ncbi:MAG TPA: alpha-amylase family glycosyl hydrolase [Capillimicrobium sp.]
MTRRRFVASAAGGAALALASSAIGRVPAPGSPADTRAWLRDAVLYGVAPHLYARGQGGWRGVADRLPELRRLGVTTIWLAPATPTPGGDFGYDPVDLFGVRTDLGPVRDFRALLAEIRRHDMRVVLDVVVNHTSRQHPWFQDARRSGPDSPYWSYYQRDARGRPRHEFDWTHLPNLDYGNPRVRDAVHRALLRWVDRFDVDGLRLDAAWAVGERAPAYWPRLRSFLHAHRPGVVLVGEASARDPSSARAFDLAYDWTRQVGRHAWEDAFEDPLRAPDSIRAALDAAGPAGPRTLRFLDNNDTGERFVTRHGPALTRVATAMLLTLDGVPSLYTGSDVGAEYEPYGPPEPISWRDRHGLRPWHRRLIALRAALPALRSDERGELPGAAPPGVLAYTRGEGPASVLVLLNAGSRPATVRLDGAALRARWGAPAARDALDGRAVPLAGLAPTVELPAHGVAVLAPA